MFFVVFFSKYTLKAYELPCLLINYVKKCENYFTVTILKAQFQKKRCSFTALIAIDNNEMKSVYTTVLQLGHFVTKYCVVVVV